MSIRSGRESRKWLSAVLLLVLCAIAIWNEWRPDATTKPSSLGNSSNTLVPAQNSATPVPNTQTKAQPQNHSQTVESSEYSPSESRQTSKISSSYSDGFASIDYQALPKEAQQVIQMIRNRSDFPHAQDGQVFGNREHLLPAQARGYYQEYTVPTPGASNRGARRIVSGKGAVNDNARSGEYYYTSDHYSSFSRVHLE